MKGDRIEIEDEWYVDTAEAAELTGYAKDYVGQLARSGKVHAKQLGRAWYVHEKSLLEHKKEVHGTAEQVSKKSTTQSATVDKKNKKQDADIFSVEKEKFEKSAEKSVEKKVLTMEDTALVASIPLRRLAVPTPTFASEKKPFPQKDPLLHTNISFHSDGPVGYEHSSGYDMPVLQKKTEAKDSARESHTIVFRNKEKNITGFNIQTNAHVEKKSFSENHDVTDVRVRVDGGCQHETVQFRNNNAVWDRFLVFAVNAPYATAIVVGSISGCCVALASLLQ